MDSIDSTSYFWFVSGDRFLLVLLMAIITAHKRSLGQGNIFTSICHSVHRGHAWQGVHGRWACMVGGMHMGGVHGRGMHDSGNVHGRGVCMVGGGGMCGGGMHGRGMCGRGHAWEGACMAGGMHGMHIPWQIL